MGNFNVLVEPWIPVLYKSGERKELGILKLLQEAPIIKKIANDSATEKIAIIRLLTAFLSDAYSLNTRREKYQLFSEGGFSETKINDYIDKCINEFGASFDLFDDKRPFMVQKYDPSIDDQKNYKSARYLCLPTYSANTPLHFNHNDEKKFLGMTPASALRNILSLYLFSTAMVHGYPSSVNNTPPLYYAPEGDSLFEQLVMCMQSIGELMNNSLNAIPAAWNDDHVVGKGKEVTNVSFVSAMTFRTRRIVIIQGNDGLIHNCYYMPGDDFRGNGLWRDPFVAYFKKTDGTYGTIKPDEKIDLWRNIGNITASGKAADTIQPRVLLPIHNESMMKVYSVGVVTNQALLIQTICDSISVPEKIMSDEYLADELRADMNLAEQILRTLNASKDIHGVWKGTFSNMHHVVNELQTQYLSIIHSELFSCYLTNVANADTESFTWKNDLRYEFRKLMGKAVNEVCNYAERMCTDWREIKFMEIDLSVFRHYVYGDLDKFYKAEKEGEGNGRNE
jgi:CRISPR type I-E-associated protein CasA/Cse1